MMQVYIRIWTLKHGRLIDDIFVLQKQVNQFQVHTTLKIYFPHKYKFRVEDKVI